MAPFAADDLKIPAEVISYCLMVNNNMVKPADEPTSWKGILDPKWSGALTRKGREWGGPPG